jgi:KipI family sensor histidine kinase inhibitor
VSAPAVETLRVAERAILVRFLDPDLPTAVARAQALARQLESRRQGLVVRAKDPRDSGRQRSEDFDSDENLPFTGECVPGAGNLLVLLPCASGGGGVVEAWRARLDAWARSLSFHESFGPRNGADDDPNRAGEPPPRSEPKLETESLFEVRYGGEEGPDLEAVAREAGVGPERVVALHAAAVYRVAFVGFSPGFAYLLGLPAELEVPRLESPRERVPAGSVAVAGPFSAIYPSATPGGWRLIGRTSAALFDPAASRPATLAPGDRVRFRDAR